MALALRHTLALRYVKLSGDFAEQAAHSPGALYLLQANTRTAAALGIQVVVTDTVDAQTARLLHAHEALTRSA